MTDLKAKKYCPIYFLMGDEPYFIDVITDYIAENVLQPHEKVFNQSVIYGKKERNDSTVLTVLDAARRFPMGSKYQVVIVKEAQNLKGNMDKLLLYITKPLKSTILVINYKYELPDKRQQLYKQLTKRAEEKSAVLFESERLYDNQLPAWITAYLSGHGYSIAPAASALLAEHLGNDLSKIVNEADKLMIVLGGKNERQITLEHIEQNVGISKEYNIFELQNALGERNVLKTNKIIQYFALNPRDHPIIMVIASLFSYFVKILTFHYLPDKGSDRAVASALRANPYFVKNYRAAAGKYPAPKVIQIISVLREYDMKSKGVDSSSTSAGDLMREMVFKIIH
ncbi:MAG: DNA polymerase III subunit delta [Bacteroidales bacterium]|jgi:DNA polymerase-3 subunit delta|nr:DNA polymerase III subunit delta [Bacteroidales bacterium]